MRAGRSGCCAAPSATASMIVLMVESSFRVHHTFRDPQPLTERALSRFPRAVFLKRFARDVLYWSASAAGRLRSREASMSGALTVLTYHRILPDAEARACPFPSLAMPETWFRAQMGWLQRNARVLPLAQAL